MITRPLAGLALVIGTASCGAGEPAHLTATYSLVSVDSIPVPADLPDGVVDGPAFAREVYRRLDFRRADSVTYSGRIEKLARQTDGSVQVQFGFLFCLIAGYARQGSMVVLRYGFPPGGTRDPWFLVSSDTLYLETSGIHQIERQILNGISYGTHVYHYSIDPPGSPPDSCPRPQ